VYKTKKVATKEDSQPLSDQPTPPLFQNKLKAATPEIALKIKSRAAKQRLRKSFDAQHVSRCERPSDINALATWQRNTNEHVYTDPQQPTTMFGVPPNYFDMNYRRLPKQNNNRF